MDHFQRLGLPRRFAFPAADLEREYLRRSREVHPDFHQMNSTGEQRASLELSSTLNEAYRVLKEPISRANYLLELEGGPAAGAMKEMPTAFLERMLELRMAIEEIRGEPEESPSRLSFEEGLVAERASRIAAIGERFEKSELVEIRKELNALKFIEGLLRDLRAE